MKRVRHEVLLLVLILLVAAALRFSGLDWDRGYLFHPDERKILLVASGLGLPKSLSEFLSPASPFNPKFFAYGSLPIYLVKALSGLSPNVTDAVPWADTSLAGLALLGRALSGLFDLGTIVLTYLLGRRLYGGRVGLAAAACLAITVLDVQLSHFYAVDTLLTFFVVLTIFLADRYVENPSRANRTMAAVSFGLAMATKITAAPLLIPIVLAIVRVEQRGGGLPNQLDATGPKETIAGWLRSIWQTRRVILRFLLIAFVAIVVVQPYAVLDPVKYVGQTATESLVARGWLDYPYTRQFVGTIPFAYQIVQSSVWGIGLPLGILAWVGSGIFVWQAWRSRGWSDMLVLAWAAAYFVLIGMQYTKYLRYLLPLMPFLYLMMAAAVARIDRPRPRVLLSAGVAAAVLLSSAYSLAFVSIYSREHPWLAISDWMYAHVMPGSRIAVEHWDEQLPSPIRTASSSLDPSLYQIQVLPMYDADDDQKVKTIVDALTEDDYIVLASPRLYATIARQPSRYPISARYYERLFNGQLGFNLVAYARNDPSLGDLKIADDPIRPAGLAMPPLLAGYWAGRGALDWGAADESFGVYDHPMPLVFKKTRHPSAEQLTSLLTEN